MSQSRFQAEQFAVLLKQNSYKHIGKYVLNIYFPLGKFHELRSFLRHTFRHCDTTIIRLITNIYSLFRILQRHFFCRKFIMQTAYRTSFIRCKTCTLIRNRLSLWDVFIQLSVFFFCFHKFKSPGYEIHWKKRFCVGIFFSSYAQKNKIKTNQNTIIAQTTERTRRQRKKNRETQTHWGYWNTVSKWITSNTNNNEPFELEFH